MSTPPIVTPHAAHRLVDRVLNSMAATEMTYHDFAHTQPLVDDLLFALLQRVTPGRRVLLVGGNSLLAHAILAATYDLDLWRFGQNLLSDELAEYTHGRLEPTMLAGAHLPDVGGPFDAMVLPLILEHVLASPGDVFEALVPSLRPGGTLIVATQNLGALRPRSRALLGKSYLPPWQGDSDVRFSLNWPDLPAYHCYLAEEVRDYAKHAGLHAIDTSYSVGRRAYHGADSFGVRGYLALLAKHWIKRVVPELRDYSVITFVTPRAPGEPMDATSRGEGRALVQY